MFRIVALTIGALDSTILTGKRLTITACSLDVRSVNGSAKDYSLDSAVGAIPLEAVISVWATWLLVAFQVCLDCDLPLGVSGPEPDRRPNESSGAEEQTEPVRPDADPETRFPAP